MSAHVNSDPHCFAITVQLTCVDGFSKQAPLQTVFDFAWFLVHTETADGWM